MNENNAKAIEILLVEDNEGDIFLTKRAFEKAKIVNNIRVARDGEVAMQMLHNEGEHLNVPHPDLILLDINLPKKDGKQVLVEMKEDVRLRRIPVIVLTSSKAEQDVLETYERHASSYIVKPIDLNKFHEVVTALETFWFGVVLLPPEVSD